MRGIKKELPPLNLIGPQVRKLRDQKGWTQEVFAEKLQLFGWDISRESLAKLENQLRRVPDGELLVLAKIMGVSLDALFPAQVNLRQLGPQFRVRLSHKFKRTN